MARVVMVGIYVYTNSKLDFAYPSNPCCRRGEQLTMVGAVGGCFVFQKTRKTVLFLRENSTER